MRAMVIIINNVEERENEKGLISTQRSPIVKRCINSAANSSILFV
jgi:hypothetical protein